MPMRIPMMGTMIPGPGPGPGPDPGPGPGPGGGGTTAGENPRTPWPAGMNAILMALLRSGFGSARTEPRTLQENITHVWGENLHQGLR